MNRRYLVIIIGIFLVALASPAADHWVIFTGQVNGPVLDQGDAGTSAFTHRKYPGLYWSETYYHQMSFPDGSMIMVSITCNVAQSLVAFAYGKPGTKPVTDYFMGTMNDVQYDSQGFGMTIGPNRIRLVGDKYQMVLDMEQAKGTITMELLCPSYTYGDGMAWYPDGKTFSYYSLPIPWARARAHVKIAGKQYDMTGYGNMNHDAGTISPFDTPANWQCFWFFGPDHAIALTDYLARKSFGNAPVQRLVFVDRDRGLFTSIEFPVQWDDWDRAKDVDFSYPRHYTLTAEGQGGKITIEVHVSDVLMLEDLFSHVPSFLKPFAEKVTTDIWTADCWADYTATYTRDGETRAYKGRGIVRWTNLEKE